MQSEIPTDNEFEQSLLELLSTQKFYLHTIHGELLDQWYEAKDSGPLIIIEHARHLADDFVEELEARYPKTTIFSLLLDANGMDTASYFIIMSHINFGAIAMYGQALSPEQFSEYLEIAKGETDDTGRDNNLDKE
jgi:hypothetical protein